MDTTKLIDAIAQADRASFDELISRAKERAEQLAADYLYIATIDAILNHSAKAQFSDYSEGVLIEAIKMLAQAKDYMGNLYPEVKDLL
jgi:DNA mismatch repair ATPase MutS